MDACVHFSDGRIQTVLARRPTPYCYYKIDDEIDDEKDFPNFDFGNFDFENVDFGNVDFGNVDMVELYGFDDCSVQ